VAVPLELLDRRPVQARSCAANRGDSEGAHQMWVGASGATAAVVGASSPGTGQAAILRPAPSPPACGAPGEGTIST
jgi:hypothetical protein